MLGNVAEWCQDSYRAAATGDNVSMGAASVVDEQATKVIRGGSAGNAVERLRSAARDQRPPGQQDSSIGFRVARSNL